MSQNTAKQSRKTGEAPWMRGVAELIVREGLSPREACTRQNVALTSTEVDNFFRTKAFQRVLRSERDRFYLEIAEDPERTKQTAIGQMLHAIEQLMLSGEYGTALEGLLKLAKVEGWLNPENVTNVFNSATTKDLDALRREILQGRRSESVASGLAN